MSLHRCQLRYQPVCSLNRGSLKTHHVRRLYSHITSCWFLERCGDQAAMYWFPTRSSCGRHSIFYIYWDDLVWSCHVPSKKWLEISNSVEPNMCWLNFTSNPQGYQAYICSPR
ncbi:hypothetical protein V2G26_016880 [Clonostachys chloroleuca]